MKKSVVFDVETSGLSPKSGHRIIEIGAVALEGEDIVREFHSLVDSDCSIDTRAVAVHGITNEVLRGNPGPREVFSMFREFVGNAQLIAHNAMFDMSFLRAEFRRFGFILPNRFICTLRLARRLYPELPDHRLETVYHHLGSPPRSHVQRHRALDDAKLTAEVWLALSGK